MRACIFVTALHWSFAAALIVRTPVTQNYVKDFQRKQGVGGSIVEQGGWFALEQKATSDLAQRNREALGGDESIVSSYFTVNTTDTVRELVLSSNLAADPKGALLQLAMTDEKAKKDEPESEYSTKDMLEALTILLRAQGRGFDSEIVDGEWVLLLQQQGSKSPRSQKLVGRSESKRRMSAIDKLSRSSFSVKDGTFAGDARLAKGLFHVTSTVKYQPTKDSFDVSKVGNKKIVLRRIGCDIVQAGIRFWKLPRLPLSFLKRKGGYLDFVYLDRDVRVTVGNRGGIFVHARPDFVREQLLQLQ